MRYQTFGNGSYLILPPDGTGEIVNKMMPHFNGGVFPDYFWGVLVFAVFVIVAGIILVRSRP